MSHTTVGLAGAVLLLGLVPLGGCAAAHSARVTGGDRGAVLPAADHERAFERLKALEGEYAVGSTKSPSATVVFRRIARGTALQEEWVWPSGARELTVFFMDNGTLRATHYCHSGIQSTMSLQGATSGEGLVFRIRSATNLPSASVAHNTGFSYVFETSATVHRGEEWTENGEVACSQDELVRRAEVVGAGAGR